MTDEALRDRWLDHATRTLSTSGRRAGAARTAIIEVLAREGQCLLTAQELLDRLGPRGSYSSVYRTLEELFGLGLLHRMSGRDGIARYEIADPERHHHHLIDETSGTAHPFTDDELERVIHAAAERLGVTLTGHEVVIRGRPSVQASHKRD
ncbi:transcriptional repressor [Solirubrobacter phytolaccae]|uniref:Transcriptional repressor n=1 Tax=Solirubrobacter phytolaccae TaxID=1404360 RepID=A0A9X3SDI6_9ACTN|nr:transcriptional repressor [Solirubrobacter phytolaccae]MDA0185796.1 transcriptional repressor [Solirubrobacter phytolaccae]